MPPPPPPGPPAPPPPPPSGGAPPPMNKDRTQLLSSIEGFKKGKLKKTETVDKSKPVISNKPAAAAAPAASPAGGARPAGGAAAAAPAAAPMGLGPMGGMFAGGVPRLRKTGLPGSSTMIPAGQEAPAPAPTPVPKVTPPAATNVAPPAALQPTRAAPAIPVAQPAPVAPSKPVTPIRPPVQPVAQPAPVQAVPVAHHSPVHAAPSHGSGEGETVLAAIYPFNAIRDTDLSLRVGDVIVNVNKSPIGGGNGNWWDGKCIHTGAKGMFPANYVKELTSVEHGVALHGYSANRPDELSISPHQQIEILLRRDSGWWLARVGSQIGLVPYNYIQMS